MRLSDWPSLRLVIPLAGGIILSDTVQDTAGTVTLSCVLCCVCLLLMSCLLLKGDRYAGLFGIVLSLAFFSLGYGLYGQHLKKTCTAWPEEIGTHSGMLQDWPREKRNSYRLDLELSDQALHGKKIILYVPKDSIVDRLMPGQRVVFHGRIENVKNDGLQDFDYARYLIRHGISGSLWVRQDHWKADSCELHAGLGVKSAILRRRAVSKLREWGLEGQALAVTAAVSIGEKSILDDGLRQIYSTSGASHVLAVSGLHVGILYWLVGLLLPSALFSFGTRWIRELLVMTVMWTYAVAIGFPISITRSLIMFSMLSVTRSLGRDNSSLNALAFAALLILAAQPEALFDISFQLSFSAVLAILLFEHGIRRLLPAKTAVGKYLWGIASVSIAAQLGTAPIVMYNFSNFSTYFLLTNLFVLPLMFVVVCLAAMIWVAGWVAPLGNVIVWLLDRLIGMENTVLENISDLPHASLVVTIASPEYVWMSYAVILALWFWIAGKRTSCLVDGLKAVALISLCSLLEYLSV